MPSARALKNYKIRKKSKSFVEVCSRWKHAKGISLRYGVIVLGNLCGFLPRIHFVIRGFSPKASGFYPWGNVVSPRKRVAEGLCGWRHGNSFPMTQSAQSHRQMRSIPLCPKAVFYVFVFDYIHDSATMLNPSPSKFPTEPKKAAGAVTSAAGKKLF